MPEETNIIKYACEVLDWPYTKGAIADLLFSRAIPDDGKVKNAPKRAIDFGDFQLKNPNFSPSPFYINLRTGDHPITPGPLTRGDARKLAEEIRSQLFMSGIQFDYVAGIPYGGEPLVQAFLDLLPDGKAREARFDKIGQGSNRRVANFKIAVPPYQGLAWKKVLLIDDVLSSGASLLEAIAAVEKAGCKVAGIAVIVDREQGGREILAKRVYGKMISVFRISQLLAFYVLTGKISLDQFNRVMEYLDMTRDMIANEP